MRTNRREACRETDRRTLFMSKPPSTRIADILFAKAFKLGKCLVPIRNAGTRVVVRSTLTSCAKCAHDALLTMNRPRTSGEVSQDLALESLNPADRQAGEPRHTRDAGDLACMSSRITGPVGRGKPSHKARDTGSPPPAQECGKYLTHVQPTVAEFQPTQEISLPHC